MKKYLLTIVSLALSVVATSAQQKLIEVKDLPQSSQSFIQKHTPKGKVSVVTMEREGAATDYKVTFKNGTTVEFNKKGEWTEMECKRNAVPTAIVPAKIATYVNARFPDEKIVKIERDKRTTDVKLSNKLELKFNSKGEMVEIDD